MVESKSTAATVEGEMIWLNTATITQLRKIEKLIRISRTELGKQLENYSYRVFRLLRCLSMLVYLNLDEVCGNAQLCLVLNL